jgi:K+-transporting ATPase ATPase C chain
MNKKYFTIPIRAAIILAIICGLIYPVAVTIVGQELIPYQSNGSVTSLNNTPIGSYLIGQSITSPYLFHIRNNSASGVDPDITVTSALKQAVIIHNNTNISLTYLDKLIHNNTRYTLLFFGTTYVNALRLNLELITSFHNTVSQYEKIYDNITKS